MKPETLIHARKRTIHVEHTSLDRQFSITIPKFEYSEWLKLNGLPNTSSSMQKFVEEYLPFGINTTDNTTALILESIFDLLTGLQDVITVEKSRKISKIFQYIGPANDEGELPVSKTAIITKMIKRNQYKLFIADKEINDPREIIELYKAILITVSSVISQLDAN